MKTCVSLFTFALLLLTACKKDTGASNDCNHVMCTADFRSIEACLRDALGEALVVDSVRTLLPDGSKASPADNMLPAPGCYGVISDNWVQGHQNTQTTMRFQAFRNGQRLVDTPFVIGADCCHISKVSGPSEIVLR